jgi:Type III restriction enzyme, res subunit
LPTSPARNAPSFRNHRTIRVERPEFRVPRPGAVDPVLNPHEFGDFTVLHHDHSEIPVVDSYTTDDAIEDGVLLDLTALAPTPRTKQLHEIGSIDEYLQSFGRTLGQKAIHALNPLHVPGRDPLPGFDDLLREPFPCQQHVIAAAIQMMDERGSGFLVGECGTGKTLLGMAAVHKHAQRSRNQGGSGGRYRALVLCPDHLIAKWAREIQDTLPDATVHRFGPQGPAGPTAGHRPGSSRRSSVTSSSILSLMIFMSIKVIPVRNPWHVARSWPVLTMFSPSRARSSAVTPTTSSPS